MRHDDLVFDVGMHLGEDTAFYLAKGYRVVGFEADPGLAARCRARFDEPIRQGRLEIVEGAIAPAERGPRVPFYASSLSVWGTVEPQWAARNDRLGARSRRLDVPRVDLAAQFAARGTPHYLKIDIEGMDRHVLETLAGLDERPRYLSIESDKVRFDALADELALLRALGYDRFKVVQQRDIPGATIPTLDLLGRPMRFTFPKHSSGPFGDDILQPWIDHDAALARYREVFDDYARFGDDAQVAARHAREPVPRKTAGWYDTHAQLADPAEARAPPVSIVVTCKDRLDHLRQTLPALAAQPDAQVIVVDYGCSQDTRGWVRRQCPSVTVVCVDDDPVFSVSRARNVGALHARGEHLAFTDADIHVDFAIADWLRRHRSEGEFYTVEPARSASLSGTAIIGRFAFLAAGGYDEALRGWGWEDTELYRRLERRGLRRVEISGHGLRVIEHGDDRRQLAAEKGGAGSRARALLVGGLYTRARQDIAQLGHHEPSHGERVALHARIGAAVDAFMASPASEGHFRLRIDLAPGRDQVTGTEILYRFRRPVVDAGAGVDDSSSASGSPDRAGD